MVGCCNCGRPKDKDIFVPRSERSCTDVFCILLLICTWAAMGTVTILSYTKEPELLTKLIYGQDAYGQFCGLEGSKTENLGKLMYPDLDGDFERQESFLATAPFWMYWKLSLTGICAQKCPQGFALDSPKMYGGPDYPLSSKASKTAVDWLLNDGHPVPSFDYSFSTEDFLSRCLPMSSVFTAEPRRLCGSPNCTTAMQDASLGPVSCASIPSRGLTNSWDMCADGTTTDMCNAQKKRCEYEVTLTSSDALAPAGWDPKSIKYTEKFSRYITDMLAVFNAVLDAKWVILLCGVGLPLLSGFGWAIFLFLFAGLIIGLLIILMFLVLLMADTFFIIKAGWVSGTALNFLDNLANATGTGVTVDPNASTENYFAVAAVISIALTLIYIIFILSSLKAIQRTVAVVQEVSKVFVPDGNGLPAIMFWPIISIVYKAFVLLYGIVGLYFILWPSVWDSAENYEALVAVFALFHIFGVLWTLSFISACDYATMAYAGANWYVTEAETGFTSCCSVCKAGCGGCDFGISEMFASSATIVMKHLGSMAFGSLLISICQFIRLVLTAMIHATEFKDLKNNFAIKLLAKCILCLMWCLQKSIEFVSYYSYVFVGIKGSSFCTGCKDTFALTCKYPAQVAVNQMVKKLLALLISFSTSIACAVICYMYLDTQAWYISQHSADWPALVALIAAWIVSDGVSQVFQCLIDTIYLSAFMDIDSHTMGPKYMSPSLREAFGIDKAESEAGKAAMNHRAIAEKKNELATAKTSPLANTDSNQTGFLGM